MNILGINFGHDASACLIINSKVAMAIEDGETETEKKEEITIKAYPNPTTGKITIEITGNYSLRSTVSPTHNTRDTLRRVERSKKILPIAPESVR